MNWIEKARRILLRSKLNMPPPEKPHEGFKLIYTDKAGNKFYTLNNPANFHASRTLPAWTFTKDSGYVLTQEKRRQAYKIINESCNKKDVATIAKVIGVMEAAEDLYAEPEILLNLATCYTFLNDEKNDSYQDHIQEEKRAIWKTDLECRSFFLQYAIQFTEKYSELQKLNVLEYLEKTKPIRDQINYHLQIRKSLTRN